MPTVPIQVYMSEEEYKIFLDNKELIKEAVKTIAKQKLNEVA